MGVTVKMSSDCIRVHQCLHGYDRGHRLLQSSTKLSLPAKALVAKKSDAASPRFGKKSPAYITGYPLVDMSSYAIAKTWPAPEMSRPGCVWTHTLLISFSDVARLNSLKQLLGIFRHPSNVGDLGEYNDVVFIENSCEPIENDSQLENLLAYVLYKLYENPNESVSIPYSDELQNAICMVWDQQWPKLRRSFKFRTFGGNESDDIVSNSPNEIVLNEAGILLRSGNEWLNAAHKDAFSASGGSLREFFWEYGADCKSTRGAYKQLATIFCMLQENDLTPSNEVWDAIESWQGRSKSLTVFLIKSALGNKGYLFSSSTLMFVLQSMVQLSESEFEESEFEALGLHLAKTPVTTLRSALLDRELTSEKVRFIVIQLLGVEVLVEFSLSSPELFELCIRHRPSIMLEPKLWGGLKVVPIEVENAIPNLIPAGAIFVTMVTAGNLQFDVKPIVAKLAKSEIEQVLNDISSLALSQNEYRHWLSQLDLGGKVLYQELFKLKGASVSYLSAFSAFLPCDIEQPEEEGEDAWLRLIDQVEQRGEALSDELSIYLMCRALSGKSCQGLSLLVRTFDTIYSLLEHSKISFDSWREIEKFLPRSRLFLDWDRCDRLRRAVALTLLNNRASGGILVGVTSRKVCFVRIVREIASFNGGDSYLKYVKDGMDMPEFHRQVIKEQIEKY